MSVPPCRVVDTRNATGAFGGPIFSAGETRSYIIPNAGCIGVPAAAAYSLNFTIVGYTGRAALSAWATDTTQPSTAILNYGSGLPVANNSIVAANGSGSIDVNVSLTANPGPTNLIIDINGYFENGVVTGLTAGTGISITGVNNLTVGIAANGVGGAQINSSEVQKRLSGSCSQGIASVDSNGILTCVSASGSAPTQKVFLPQAAASVYTVPAGVTVIQAEAWGGGGGASDSNGGGGAGYVRAYLLVTPGETLTVASGLGGQAGPTIGASGTAGGDTYIKRGATAILTAPGGGGGTASNRGAGGLATTSGTIMQEQDGAGTNPYYLGGNAGLNGSNMGHGGDAPVTPGTSTGSNGFNGLLVITPFS